MKVYDAYKSELFLKEYLPVAENKLTKNVKEALNFTKKINFPVVLKIISPKIIHKTDVKGVRLVYNKEDAESMINDLRMKDILFGVRGEEGVNINLLKSILVKISRIPLKHKNIKEFDINPLILNSKNAKIIDARIVF